MRLIKFEIRFVVSEQTSLYNHDQRKLQPPVSPAKMTATLTPDTDLVRFLDADDTEQFEMEREAAHGTWGQAVPALLDDPHSRLSALL